MSPEYAMHGQFSVKSDVYSFGVLILEIVSGKKNSSFYNWNRGGGLLSYVRQNQAFRYMLKQYYITNINTVLKKHEANLNQFWVYKIKLLQAWEHWNEESMHEFVDPMLGEQYSSNEVMRCVHVALLCVQDRAAKRPPMATVVHLLNSYRVTASVPSKPAFVQKQVESNQSTSSSNPVSVYDRTITELYPR